MSSRRRFLAALGAASVAGCTAPLDTDGSGTPTETIDHSPPPDVDWEPAEGSPTAADVRPTTLVENLEIPWDLAFTPDGELFVTERTGRVARFDGDEVRTVTEPDDAIDAGALEPGSDERPWWVDGGEGGTLGVAVHPEYPDPAYVYVYYTSDGGQWENKVVRYDAHDDDPASTVETIVDGIPANNYHNGGRLEFGPRNYLWVTTGDAGAPERAQNPGTLHGKVLRLTAGGDAAPDNPDHGGDPRVFSYGHRNPQGVSWLPDGTPIASEHGPTGRDEVYLLEAGANYGWPAARTADEYRANPEYHRPLLTTGNTSWAPTGCVFYTGDAVPEWKHRFVVGTLIGQHVNVVTLTPPDGDPPPLDGDAQRFDDDWFDDSYLATSHKLLQDELGRVRRVAQGPDGELFAITSNRDGRAKEGFPRETDDVLVRLEPA